MYLNRKLKTETAIEKSLLALLEKTPLNKISVSSLCAKAGINRSTFYSHYEDIYALVDALATKFGEETLGEAEKLMKVYETIPLREAKRVILETLKSIKNEKALYRLLYAGYSKEYFLPRLIDSLVKWSSGLYVRQHDAVKDIESVKYRLYMTYEGATALGKKWLDNDCVDKEEVLTEEISKFLATNINAIWNEE